MSFKITLFYHRDWKEYVFVYKSHQKCGDPLDNFMLHLQMMRWEAKVSVPWNKEELHFSLNSILKWSSTIYASCNISCLVENNSVPGLCSYVRDKGEL